MLLYLVENFNHVTNALYRAKVGDMHDKAFVRLREFGAPLGGQRIAAVKVAVNKVVDYLHVLADFEFLHRALLQVVGNRGHAVTLFNGVTRHRKIRAVGAHNGYVRSVERGYKRKPAGLSARGKHLPGQQRAH